MGLCKCPKRVVTNQFCYEHKVNVCEYCMVTNHPKCIVLSYLKWLQDGDYNPICDLCSRNLTDDECVRLVCYHVFHWTCINHYAKQLSHTITLPSFTCPSCNSSIFPSSNLVSPVADVLRKKFETVNWARMGLGLPKLTEEVVIKEETSKELKYHDGFEYTSPQQLKSKETILHIDESVGSIPDLENKYPDNVPRRLTHVSDKKFIHPQEDYDDNKYRRKNESKVFIDSYYSCTRRSKYFQFFRRNRHRRRFFVCAFLFVAFFFFMLVLEKLGSHVPIDDPMMNPNIRVKDMDS